MTTRPQRIAEFLEAASKELTSTMVMVNEITGEPCEITGHLSVTGDEVLSIDMELRIGGSTHVLQTKGKGLHGALIAFQLLLDADKWARQTGAACMAPTNQPQH